MNVLIYEKISNWYFKYKDIDIWKINTLIYGITNNWHLEYKYVDRGKDRLLRGGKKDYWEAERKNIERRKERILIFQAYLRYQYLISLEHPEYQQDINRVSMGYHNCNTPFFLQWCLYKPSAFHGSLQIQIQMRVVGW